MNIEKIMTDDGKNILRQLNFLPHIHIVGGYVRDLMMNIIPSDIDLATSASPMYVKSLCKPMGIDVVASGIKHGTVTLIMDDVPYELTTFRSDFNCDGRHANVQYVSSIEEDLARRDFTVNAMAIDSDYNLIDPFEGRQDLGVIKCVGDPFVRFTEDKLRIVRGLRLAARYAWEYDTKTYNAMITLAAQVFQFVTVERFVMEMNKAFAKDGAGDFLVDLYNLGIIQDFIPAFKGTDKLPQNPQYHPDPVNDVWSHTVDVVGNSEGVEAKWIALFHDIGKSDTYERVPHTTYYSYKGHAERGAKLIPRIGRKLKLPNYLIHKMTECARHHMRAYHIMPFMKKNKVRHFQYDVTAEYLPLLRALCIADAKGRKDINLAVFDLMPEEIVFKPAVSGEEIMKFFASAPPYNKPGPAVGRLKKIGMDYQLETGCVDISLILNRLMDEVYPDIVEELKEKDDENIYI